MYNWLGKYIIIAGIILVIFGLLVVLLGDKIQYFGKLPGDIRIEKEHIKIYIPITTMLIICALLSFIIFIIKHIK